MDLIITYYSELNLTDRVVSTTIYRKVKDVRISNNRLYVTTNLCNDMFELQNVVNMFQYNR